MKLKLNHLFIAIIVLLLASNVATVITFRNHLTEDHAMAVIDSIEMPDRQIGRFFRDELELKNDQMDQFRQFRRTYNRSANGVLSSMNEIRQDMVKELRDVHPNRENLDDLAGELGALHEELKGLTFDYYFAMQSVLNEDQQGRMVDIFQSMLTEQGYAKTPEHNHNDGQQGRGRGRNQHFHEDEFEETSSTDEFIEFEEE